MPKPSIYALLLTLTMSSAPPTTVKQPLLQPAIAVEQLEGDPIEKRRAGEKKNYEGRETETTKWELWRGGMLLVSDIVLEIGHIADIIYLRLAPYLYHGI